jgi:hypothetical protein
VRRRKVTYPTPKTATKGAAAARAADPRNPGYGGRVVSIDLTAMQGGAEVRIGDRVRITSGLFAGEAAVVEGVAGGLIPAVVVRTEAGRARRARTIDLEPLGSAQKGAPAGPRSDQAPEGDLEASH